MDEKGRERIDAFDRLLTNDALRMMKVFLSYLPPQQQGALAVYIKFSELQYTLQFLRRFPGRPLFMGNRHTLSFHSLLDGSLLTENQEGVLELLDELLPFSGPRERAQILNLKNLLTSLSRMREMMDMMEMMKDLFPEGAGAEGGAGDIFQGADPSAVLQMFQMFQSPSGDSAKTSE